jgi:cadmium resistance protein CadD (predicted permease)
MAEPAFLLEAALIGAAAVVATNLDNLLLSLNMAQAEGIRRAASALLAVQILVIAVALGLSQGLEAFPGQWISYLGILPIGLGIRELLRKQGSESGLSAIGTVQSALVLASNSGDSLAVLVVTLSDDAEQFDPIMTIGACAAAVALTAALILLSRWSALQSRLGPVASKIQPWLMILIGLFVLWDTSIDVQ